MLTFLTSSASLSHECHFVCFCCLWFSDELMQKTYTVLLTGVVVGKSKAHSSSSSWLSEAGMKEEGRRGKSWRVVLSADAALFGWMDGWMEGNGRWRKAGWVSGKQECLALFVFFYFQSALWISTTTCRHLIPSDFYLSLSLFWPSDLFWFSEAFAGSGRWVSHPVLSLLLDIVVGPSVRLISALRLCTNWKGSHFEDLTLEDLYICAVTEFWDVPPNSPLLAMQCLFGEREWSENVNNVNPLWMLRECRRCGVPIRQRSSGCNLSTTQLDFERARVSCRSLAVDVRGLMGDSASEACVDIWFGKPRPSLPPWTPLQQTHTTTTTRGVAPSAALTSAPLHFSALWMQSQRRTFEGKELMFVFFCIGRS